MNIYSGKLKSMNNKFLQKSFISPTLQIWDTRDKMIIKSNIYTISDEHRAVLLYNILKSKPTLFEFDLTYSLPTSV